MRGKLFLVLIAPLVLSTCSFAQAGSLHDLRADEQRLRQEEYQLDRDRDQLRFDRQHHAPPGQIRADEARIHSDRYEIKRLRGDIRRDRRLRRRYRAQF